MKPFILCFFLATSAFAETSPLSVKADLAGNGQSQVYALQIDQPKTDEPFEGGKLISGKSSIELGAEFQGYSSELNVFRVSGDSKRQVLVVSAVGDSDWTVRLLFSLQDGQLKQVGKIEGQGEMTIPGNGTLIAKTWTGFWMKTEKYVFNKDLTLTPYPQEFYSVDAEGTVLKSFPVYKTRSTQSVLANTRLESKFQILLWDPASQKLKTSDENYSMDGEWFLIRTESGFVGWVLGKHLQFEYAELPWAG